MIFLPNNRERFCASLRNYIQRRTLTSAITSKQREILKKIYFIEAILKSGEEQPLAVGAFSKELLGALQIKRMENGEKLRFSVETDIVVLTDLKVLEILLVLIVENTSYIRIFSAKRRLVIETQSIDKGIISPLITALKGNSFYELKSGRNYIVIPASVTAKPSVKIKREWEYLQDPFSSVNLAKAFKPESASKGGF